jgi:glycosyltransferase involved in cell wall biosynthesis
MNVLIVQRRLTEYRVPLFERLRAVLAERGIRLAVLHGTPARDEAARRDEGVLPWAVRTRSRYMTILGRRLSWVHVPRAVFAAQDLVLVTHENGIISNYPLLARRRLGGPNVAWWGHGPKLLGSEVAMAERLKAMSARWGAWYFAYTGESVRRALAAGVPPDRITCLDNAVERQTAPSGDASDGERKRLKHELGIGEGPVAVHLGSLTSAKRIPILLRAGDALARMDPRFQMLVVGDGPCGNEVKTAATTRSWLRPVGARQGREKFLICTLGHAMLNPGMVGLNVVDAFMMALPLVTMRHDLHSPEIAYLEDGRNGVMVDDDFDAFVAGAYRVLTDTAFRERLQRGCKEGAERYTLERMTLNFADGIEAALPRASRLPNHRQQVPALTVAVVVRTFLPYHTARLRRLRTALQGRNVRLHEIEVASKDAAYGFAARDDEGIDRLCCFPGVDYQSLTAWQIHRKVTELLDRLRPDVVIGHATPFPEGMAAIAYRNRSATRAYVVDDAWQATDRSSDLVRIVKRLIHQSVDGAIVSSPTHARHYATLGIPEDRSVTGWSVVDNEYFAVQAKLARQNAAAVRARLNLPPRYFLFVGRFLERKGISILLRAHDLYASGASEPWPVVLVGGGNRDLPPDVQPSPTVHFAGRLFGDDLAQTIALAGALIVPSLMEQWGLVINEAMASGTPVIASRACGGAQLLRNGENGWTFDTGDVAALAGHLAVVDGMRDDTRADMGRAAQRDVSEWGLDRFVDAVWQALRTPRRPASGLASRLAVKLWKGRVRAY